MLKVTDPEYFLPVIEALVPGKVLSSGKTLPMVIQGICTSTHNKNEYVVKLRASRQLFAGSNLFEMMGAFIALELGLQVPEPVVVNLSPEFVSAMGAGSHQNHSVAVDSLGFNYGSALQLGVFEMARTQPVRDQLLDKLAELFAFDILIGNPDRRVLKPNFLTNGKDLVIFDHESAFSFTMLLGFARTPTPWLIPDIDIVWIKDHYCFDLLKARNYDFSTFAARLTRLDDNFWQRCWDIIPDEWHHESFQVIKEYITKIVANRNQFSSELNRILQ